MADRGRAYTTGESFRARAEAQQRRFRAEVLELECGKYGHLLSEEDGKRGMNFCGRGHAEVLARANEDKGVDRKRTEGNMLSSQAMCFNIFGNLRTEEGKVIAAKALRRFLRSIQTVKEIHIEYTPSPCVFGDQSGRGGVDCDVLIEYGTAKGGGLLAIETKFVEEEFSRCGFRRRPGAAKQALSVCREGASQGADFSGCLYASKKGYRYWEQSRRLGTLKAEILRSEAACPFGGGLWQLWVNHTLVHAEARERGYQEAAFAVCAPRDNDALLKGGDTIATFQRLLTNPQSMLLITVEELTDALEVSIGTEKFWRDWIAYLRARYVV